MYDSRPKERPKAGARGEANPAAKLTRRQVLQIRAQADRARLLRPIPGRRGRRSLLPPGFVLSLAWAFGVSRTTIYDILARTRWRDV